MTLRIPLALWLCALLLVAQAGYAGIIKDGTPTEVYRSDDLDIIDLALHRLEGAALLCTWRLFDSDFSRRLPDRFMGRIYDQFGNPMGEAFEFERGGNQFYPIAASPSGSILGLGFDLSNVEAWRLLFQRYDRSGRLIGTPFPLDGGVQGPVRGAALPDGGFLAVEEGGFPFSLSGVRVTSLGEPSPERIEIGRSDEDNIGVRFPSIAVAPDGGFVVAWGAEHSRAVWARAFDARAQPRGDRFAVVEAGQVTNSIYRGPFACFDGAGKLAISWRGNGHSAQFRRYGADLQPDGLGVTFAGVPLEGGLVCLDDGGLLFLASNSALTFVRFIDSENRPLGQIALPKVPSRLGGRPFDPTAIFVGSGRAMVGYIECPFGSTACAIVLQNVLVTGAENCPGDCLGDGEVTIDDVMVALRMALNEGGATCSNCGAADTDLDCQIGVHELVAAVGAALHGCESR